MYIYCWSVWFCSLAPCIVHTTGREASDSSFLLLLPALLSSDSYRCMFHNQCAFTYSNTLFTCTCIFQESYREETLFTQCTLLQNFQIFIYIYIHTLWRSQDLDSGGAYIDNGRERERITNPTSIVVAVTKDGAE